MKMFFTKFVWKQGQKVQEKQNKARKSKRNKLYYKEHSYYFTSESEWYIELNNIPNFSKVIHCDHFVYISAILLNLGPSSLILHELYKDSPLFEISVLAGFEIICVCEQGRYGTVQFLCKADNWFKSEPHTNSWQCQPIHNMMLRGKRGGVFFLYILYMQPYTRKIQNTDTNENQTLFFETNFLF